MMNAHGAQWIKNCKGGERMSEKKPNMLILAVLVVIAVFTVLAGAAEMIDSCDVTMWPTPIVDILVACKWVLVATPIAIAIGFGRNLVGYGMKWLRVKRTNNGENVTYSMTWMTETMVKFEGFIVVVTPFINGIILNLPEEQKALAMAATGGLFALIDMLLSEIKRVMKETEIPIAATPGMPSPS